MDLDSLIPDEEESPKMTRRERYAASPPSPSIKLASVGQLLSSKDPAQVNRARELLQRESRYGLWCKLVGATNKRARITAWLINCEYTRRGVPPVFRDALVINDDDMELRLDSVAVDLEWI